MHLSRTLAAGAGAVLLATAPVAAFANGTNPDLNQPEYWEGILTDEGYENVECDKDDDLSSQTWTADADYVAVIIKAGSGEDANDRHDDVDAGTELQWRDGSKDISHVIYCTGDEPEEPTEPEPTEPEPTEPEPTEPEPTEPEPTEPEPTEPEPTEPEPTGPPVETDGPSERPVNGALWFGVGSLLAGAGALVLGRRLTQS